MNAIRTKLDQINRFWYNQIYQHKSLQDQVVWEASMESYCMGDILTYFGDALEIIARKPKKGDLQDNIFYVIGLLQTMYVHQDLIDELLRLFKIQEKINKKNNTIRKIRNELIGHPISRHQHDKSLKSTVFFGKHISSETLHYIKYAKDKGFKGEENSYKIQNLIQDHYDFLNKYLDIIIDKIYTMIEVHNIQSQK
jgi:hypothetical protein